MQTARAQQEVGRGLPCVAASVPGVCVREPLLCKQTNTALLPCPLQRGRCEYRLAGVSSVSYSARPGAVFICGKPQPALCVCVCALRGLLEMAHLLLKDYPGSDFLVSSHLPSFKSYS